MKPPAFTESSAVFGGEQNEYRYLLTRQWETEYAARSCVVTFVLLNPSTADERQLDPTVRRCLGYALDWGFAGLHILNLFALRSTDPRALKKHHAPVGPLNDGHIARTIERSALIVCGWGRWGMLYNRSRFVREELLAHAVRPVVALATTAADGEPGHPLYLPKAARFQPVNGLRKDDAKFADALVERLTARRNAS